MADNLLGFRDKRAELVAGIHGIAGRVDGVSNLQDQFADGSSGPLKDICPFTAMGIFNRGTTMPTEKLSPRELAKFPGVEESFPMPLKEYLFSTTRNPGSLALILDRQPDDIDALWEIFADAIRFADSDDARSQGLHLSKPMTMRPNGSGWLEPDDGSVTGFVLGIT